MPIGQLVVCKIPNNGELLWFWQHWFKNARDFIFQRGVYYTMVNQDNKIFVIDRAHKAYEFDHKTFKILFKKI